MPDNVPFTDHERVVGSHLLAGRQHAITIRQLRVLTALTEREIKQTIRDLRMRHNVPICGEKAAPGGYYIAETPEELDRAVHLLMDQAIAMIRAAQPIARHARRAIAAAAGQMRIALDELEAA